MCLGEVASPKVGLVIVKLLWNSLISTEGTKFMTLDLNDFYLNTSLKRFEYLKIRMNNILQGVIDEYKLHDNVTPDGHVYAKVCKGMYGMPIAGLVTQKDLEVQLAENGYRQSKIVSGLWHH